MGEPPSIEVTISQLNDNIDKQFLKDMVQKFGVLEELSIYYHPATNKHLGLGRVVFETVKAAKACVEKLNNTSVMGKQLQVILDPFGEKCKQLFEEAVAEKKPPQPPPLEDKKQPSSAAVEPDVKKLTDDETKKNKEEKDVVDVVSSTSSKKCKERDEIKLKERDRYSTKGAVAATGGSYLHSARGEFATPSSSDLGYATAPSEYSAGYGSAGTTPLQ